MKGQGALRMRPTAKVIKGATVSATVSQGVGIRVGKTLPGRECCQLCLGGVTDDVADGPSHLSASGIRQAGLRAGLG